MNHYKGRKMVGDHGISRDPFRRECPYPFKLLNSLEDETLTIPRNRKPFLFESCQDRNDRDERFLFQYPPQLHHHDKLLEETITDNTNNSVHGHNVLNHSSPIHRDGEVGKNSCSSLGFGKFLRRKLSNATSSPDNSKFKKFRNLSLTSNVNELPHLVGDGLSSRMNHVEFEGSRKTEKGCDSVKFNSNKIDPQNLRIQNDMDDRYGMKIITNGTWNGCFGDRGYNHKSDNREVPVTLKFLEITEHKISQDHLCDQMSDVYSVLHPHIIKIYGLSTSSLHHIVVMESTPYGTLHRCLRNYRTEVLAHSSRSVLELNVLVLCRFTNQIADGMKYLTNGGLIHGDLSALNIMVFSAHLCKVSGYASSHTMGHSLKGYDQLLTNDGTDSTSEMAWWSPEAARTLKFSGPGDVWSYGTLLWEMFSYGTRPWNGMTGTQIFEALTKINLMDSSSKDQRNSMRARHTKPNHCPADYYNALIVACWNVDPLLRPSFGDICDILSEIEPELVKAVTTTNATTYSALSYETGDVIVVLDKEPADDVIITNERMSSNRPSYVWKGMIIEGVGNQGAHGSRFGGPALFDARNTVSYISTCPPKNLVLDYSEASNGITDPQILGKDSNRKRSYKRSLSINSTGGLGVLDNLRTSLSSLNIHSSKEGHLNKSSSKKKQIPRAVLLNYQRVEEANLNPLPLTYLIRPSYARQTRPPILSTTSSGNDQENDVRSLLDGNNRTNDECITINKGGRARGDSKCHQIVKRPLPENVDELSKVKTADSYRTKQSSKSFSDDVLSAFACLNSKKNSGNSKEKSTKVKSDPMPRHLTISQTSGWYAEAFEEALDEIWKSMCQNSSLISIS